MVIYFPPKICYTGLKQTNKQREDMYAVNKHYGIHTSITEFS